MAVSVLILACLAASASTEGADCSLSGACAAGRQQQQTCEGSTCGSFFIQMAQTRKGEGYVGAARDPTYQDFLDVKELIYQEIEDSTCAKGSWDWNDTINDCKLFPKIRNPKPLGSRLLRLSFHDAAGFSDGFVDMSVPDNAELDSATKVLDRVYNQRALKSSGDNLRDVLSKADFYAWSYIAAVHFGAQQQDTNALQDSDIIPDIPVTYGRVTHEEGSGPAPTESFPKGDGHATYAVIMDYFKTKFDFTPEEAIALLGAHTLGGARISASGFAGMWTQSKNKLNVAYYENLVNPAPLTDCSHGSCSDIDCGSFPDRCKGWEQVKMDGGKFQWRHSCDAAGSGCTHVMLNSDMALYRDIDGYTSEAGDVIAFPSDSQCGTMTASSRILASCFKTREADGGQVADYSGNLAQWIGDFTPVFDRMIRSVPAGVTLRELSAEGSCGTGTVPNGDACPAECSRPAQPGLVECSACASCWCGLAGTNGANDFRCRPASWTP